MERHFRRFSGNFPKLLHENVDVIFLESLSFQQLSYYFNQMTSLQTPSWQTSNYFRTLKESIFLGIFCCLKRCVREKEQFWKYVFRKFRNFRTFFPFRDLPEKYLYCSFQFGSRLQTVFVHVFFSIFSKISVNLFQNTSIKLSVSEFSRALGCGLQYYVLTVF